MDEDIGDGCLGIVLGAIVGGLLGLGVCVWFLTETWLFPGDTILIGATACGCLGFWLGEPFLEFLKILIRLLH